MNFQQILIVTNYRTLFAYMIQQDGCPQVLEHVDFQHDSQTSVPLIQWRGDESCYKVLAEKITSILERYRPESWCLACPGKLGEALRKELPIRHLRKLSLHRSLNVEDVDISNIAEVFRGCCGEIRELEYA